MVSSGNSRGAIQSRREFAHFAFALRNRFPGLEKLCKSEDAVGWTSNCLAANCQHRYPSPCRPDPISDRPTTPGVAPSFHIFCATIRFGRHFCLALSPQRLNQGGRATSKEGKSKCVKHLLHFQQSHSWVFLGALTMMQSGHWLAQALAALQAKLLTMIAPPARLQAAWQAHCPTTSDKDFALNAQGATLRTSLTTSLGLGPAAFFVLGRHSHV